MISRTFVAYIVWIKEHTLRYIYFIACKYS